MLRLVLIPLAAVFLLLIAGVLMLPLLLDKEKVLEIATDQLHQRTGATLTVAGETSFSLFPVLGISLEDAAVAMAGETEPGLRTDALSIGVRLRPLISGTVEIDSLEVNGLLVRTTSAPDAEAVDTSRMSDQELDAFYAARRAMREQAGANAGAGAAIGLPLALNVAELLLTNARFETIDGETGEVSVVEVPRFKATELNLAEKPIPLSMELRVEGVPPVIARLDGVIKIDQAVQRITLDRLSLVVSGATREPLKLETRGDVDIDRQIADLTLELELGPARGEGTLRFASYESPQIDTELKLNQASPALFALAGPEGAAGASGETSPVNGDAPLPLEAIRLIDTRAKLAIEQVLLEPHELNEVNISLRAVDGVMTLHRLTGMLHGGQLDLTATFNGKHNTASLKSAGKLEALDIETALAAMDSEPVFGGTASLEWDLTGRGKSANELIAGLKGPINLTTGEPVLKGTSVQAMLCEAVALVNQERLTTTFATDTSFQELGAKLALADGKLNLQPLRATLPGIQLTGKGNLELLTREFDTTFKARLSPELEKVDRACRVSKRLTAIDWPVKCKGNVAEDPAQWCRVNTDAIIEDLATNEAKRQLEKEAGKLLDKLFN
jgi:uncharacterized protein involved in outer membrane biogenesis